MPHDIVKTNYAIITLVRILGEHIHVLSYREREEARKAILDIDPDADVSNLEEG